MESFQKIYKNYQNNRSILYAWFEALHTRIDIILCDKSENESTNTVNTIKEELTKIERIGNRFDPNSEISKINQFASKKAIHISPNLFHIVKDCVDYHFKTEGCFDITINSVNYTQSNVSFIKLDQQNLSILFENENTKIDLNGYLKGYALDKVKEIIKLSDVQDALINLGNSSICGIGNQPNGNGWKVDIESSICDNETDRAIILHNKCFTTSGNLFENRKHIKSPETGLYVEDVKSVSVITDSGTEGEVLSTALFVADKEKRERILKTFPVENYIV